MKIENLIAKFDEFGQQNGFLYQNNRILVGFSGGCDSVALILLLLEIQEKYSLFIMAAHVNYNLRGDDSRQDEQFVKEFCFNRNIPLCVLKTRIDKAENIQNKARNIRLQYFNKIKKNYKINYIALAHHKDDQAETIMYRFIRGSGFKGLSGIQPTSGVIIHPVLCFTKENLEAYISQKNITYRVDKSNQINEYTRNKIRNELIPNIKKEFNSNFSEKLVEYGQLFSIADSYFQKITKKELKKSIIESDENIVSLEVSYILKVSPILQFYILKAVWTLLSGSEMDFFTQHFKDILSMINSEKGYKEISLPENIKIIKDYNKLIYIKEPLFKNKPKELSKEIASIRSVFTFNGCRFYMQKLKQIPENDLFYDSCSAIIDLDKIVFPIKLRFRENGDRFIPFGMNNFKKIKDFFIDKKISKLDRDKIVVFTDMEKIFWVSGFRIDQRVAVNENTKNYLLLKQEKCTETRKLKIKI